MFNKLLSLLLIFPAFNISAMTVNLKNDTDEKVMVKVNYLASARCSTDTIPLKSGESYSRESGNCCVTNYVVFSEDGTDEIKVDVGAGSNCTILKVDINVAKENNKLVSTRKLGSAMP